MDTFILTISWIATAFGFFKFFPQTVRVLKKRSVEGLSPYTFIIYLMGASLWIMYTAFVGVDPSKSFFKSTFAPFIGNLLNVTLILPILWLMFKNKLIPTGLAAFGLGAIAAGFSVYGTNTVVPPIGKLIIVIAAGTFTGLGFFPQVIKTFRDKQAKEFSLASTWLGGGTDLLLTICWSWWTVGKVGGSGITLSTFIIATAFTGILTILLFILIVIVPYYNKKAGLIEGPVYSIAKFKAIFIRSANKAPVKTENK